MHVHHRSSSINIGLCFSITWFHNHRTVTFLVNKLQQLIFFPYGDMDSANLGIKFTCERTHA
ncbi:hypothetical protein Leryth_023153, partial [Lithospermum erythrorhizon]